ncbi:hypothetical protein, partial [Rhizobium lusitanum]|uniref:hypothetical protein n=1 Tax=Rhizobium lusitanum TaxID=293958 RepID=UPI00195E18C8
MTLHVAIDCDGFWRSQLCKSCGQARDLLRCALSLGKNCPTDSINLRMEKLALKCRNFIKGLCSRVSDIVWKFINGTHRSNSPTAIIDPEMSNEIRR